MIYYIRAIETDWPELLALGALLGVLAPTQDGKGVGSGWVYVGKLRTDEITDIQSLPPYISDGEGRHYIHANLVMDGSLRDLAEAKSSQYPELAQALSQIPKYFLTDGIGQQRAPANPAVVIA